LASSQRPALLRQKAPQIIAITIIVAICVYFTFEILQDFSLGHSWTSGPLVGSMISLTKNVKDTIYSWRYGGIFGLMILEASSIPIPSEIILPFAGFMVFKGLLNFWITVAVSTIAGVIGSMIDYYIGYKGVHILQQHRIIGRIFFTKGQLEVAARWFGHYGAPVVIFSRLIPGFRTIVSFPAGAVRMPLAKFVIYTTIGCLIWNTILIYVGDFLGENWEDVASVLHYFIIATVIGVVILVAGYFIWRRRKTVPAEVDKSTI
jgi:membrane protein DedA with SNARE-associated domain